MDFAPLEETLSHKLQQELSVVQLLLARLRQVLAQQSVASANESVTPEASGRLNELCGRMTMLFAWETHNSELDETSIAAECPQLISVISSIQAGREALQAAMESLAARAEDSRGRGDLLLTTETCARELQGIEASYLALNRREADLASQAAYDDTGGEN